MQGLFYYYIFPYSCILIKERKKNMNLDQDISKAMDAFYWGDTGPNAKDEYTSGYKLLHKDESTIHTIGKVLMTLIAERKKHGRS